MDRGVSVIAYPELREWGNLPCSTGSSREALEKEFPEAVDLTLVPHGWEWNRESLAPCLCARKQRVEEVRRQLWMLGLEALRRDGGKWKHLTLAPRTREQQNVDILVISHGGFLGSLEGSDGRSLRLQFFKMGRANSNRLTSSAEQTYYNAQYKSYEFASMGLFNDGCPRWTLVETKESRKRSHSLFRS